MSTDLKTIFRLSILLSAVVASGCAICRRPLSETPNCCPVPPVHRLSIVDYSSRNPIQLNPQMAPHTGVPLGEQDETGLRDLTIAQCENLAAQSSPVAEQLRSERAILCQSNGTPSIVFECLDLQEAHERNESAGQAMRAYLNLVEIYLQHELLLESHTQVDRAAETVARIRSEGLTAASDDGELQRQHLALDGKVEEIRHQSAQLHAQLQSLLRLDERQSSPIWTNFQSDLEETELDPEAELAVALANRGDLAALERLASANGSNELLEWLQAAARGVSPLLAVIARGPGILASHRSEQDRDRESANRQCQLDRLAQHKRDQIRFEVFDAVDSIRMHRRVMNLKRQAIASLQDSIAAAERGKDLKPVELSSQLENQQALLKLRSEYLHERVGYEADLVKLRQAQGLLGRSDIPTGELVERRLPAG